MLNSHTPKRRIFAALLVASFFPEAPHKCPASELAPILGRQIESFTLQDFRGKEHSLSDFSDRRLVVVAFLGTECPLAKLYAPRLSALAAEYKSRGVAVVGIDANQQDSLTELAAYARRHEVSFPLLKDAGNRVADQFGATRTPEVFLLDAGRRIAYHGRIDDQYGVGFSREAPERQDLREAIYQLLVGRPIEIAYAPPVGCLIGRVREPNDDSPVTYSNQIARLLNKHCVECHRDDEIAPFALSNYDEVVGWAGMLEEVVRTQRMPPWHADPAHGHFANERLMAAEEKALLYEWVRQGAPEGDPAELPPPPEFVTGWRLPREPDLVIPIRDKPFVVPAEGTVEYQYFALDPKFTEDKWVSAADVVPGERSVVHHVIVFISPPQERSRRGIGLLAAYVPGQQSMQLPPGQARLIPAGSKLVFQMHYTPVGSEKRDLTKVGLVFADPETITEEVVTLVALDEKFEIPPRAANHCVDAVRDNWPTGSKLLAMGPHMHLRGKSFRFEGVWPDGRRETLLDIPHYDFNWQTVYELSEPLPLEDGFAIECVAHFDNSARNLVNPDPSAAVRWGDQTWDEMMIAFFEVSVPRGSWQMAPRRPPPELTDADRADARKFAREFLRRFDTNGDGRIARKEAPRTFSQFGFWRFDADGDQIVTEEEIYAESLHDRRHS